ncbi:MAG: hypothetical protein U1F77_00125 [Kiritimatiellia bacterium]
MIAILALLGPLARPQTNVPPAAVPAPPAAPAEAAARERVPPPRPPGPPGLGATESEVREVHGDPDGIFRYKNRTSFMYARRGRFEFEDGVVVRMKWEGNFQTLLTQPELASQPYTVAVRPEIRPPGTRPGDRVVRKSDGRFMIVTNTPPNAARKP